MKTMFIVSKTLQKNWAEWFCEKYLSVINATENSELKNNRQLLNFQYFISRFKTKIYLELFSKNEITFQKSATRQIRFTMQRKKEIKKNL